MMIFLPAEFERDIELNGEENGPGVKKIRNEEREEKCLEAIYPEHYLHMPLPAFPAGARKGKKEGIQRKASNPSSVRLTHSSNPHFDLTC